MTNDEMPASGWASNGHVDQRSDRAGWRKAATYYWQVRAINDAGHDLRERLGHGLLELHNGNHRHLGISAS